jgi:hypothetical protein
VLSLKQSPDESPSAKVREPDSPLAHSLRQRVQGHVPDVPTGGVEHRGEFPARCLPNPPALLLRKPEPEVHLGLFLEAEDRQYLPLATKGEYFQSSCVFPDY